MKEEDGFGPVNMIHARIVRNAAGMEIDGSRTRIVTPVLPSLFSMPAPDAKTRNKISLSPKIFGSSIQRHLPRILLTSVLYAASLHAGKGLLDFDVGVFWVVMRVLASAGVGVLVWEARTGQLAKRKSIEVRGNIP